MISHWSRALVASTQGHFGKEAKRNELAFLLSNDNKIKCFTADRKTVFILLFSRSARCVQFRTAFGVLPYHIPVVGIHSDRTIFYTCATRIILIYNEVKKRGVMRTKKCCRDVQLGLSTFQCLCYSSELKIILILEPPLCRLKRSVGVRVGIMLRSFLYSRTSVTKSFSCFLRGKPQVSCVCFSQFVAVSFLRNTACLDVRVHELRLHLI